MRDAIFLKDLPVASVDYFVELAAAHMLERGIAKYNELYDENGVPKPQGFKGVLHRIVDMFEDGKVADSLLKQPRPQKMLLRSQLSDLREKNPAFFKFFTGFCYNWNGSDMLWRYSVDGGAFNACVGEDCGINRETGVSKDSGYPEYMLYASLGSVARRGEDESVCYFLDMTDLDIAEVENGYEFNVVSVEDGKPTKHRVRVEFVCHTNEDCGMYKHIIDGDTVFYCLRGDLTLYVNRHGWAAFNSDSGTGIHCEMHEGSMEENYEAAANWLDTNGFFREGERLSFAEVCKATREYGAGDIEKAMTEDKEVREEMRQSPIIKEMDAFVHIQAKSFFKGCCLHFPIYDRDNGRYREIPLPRGNERAFGLIGHRHPMSIVLSKHYFTVRVEPTVWRYIYLCKERFDGDLRAGYMAALDWCLERGFIDAAERAEMEAVDLEKYSDVSYEVKCPWNDVRLVARAVSAPRRPKALAAHSPKEVDEDEDCDCECEWDYEDDRDYEEDCVCDCGDEDEDDIEVVESWGEEQTEW